MRSTQKPSRWLTTFRASESFVILVVSIAIFTDAFIYGVIVPIIPLALVDRIGTRQEDAQSWVSLLLAVYGASLLVGSPLFGYFADQCRSRRLPFIFGLIALGASTGLFIVATSLFVLIVARALQGLSAAAVWVVGLAVIADNVPLERVSEALGYTTIALTWGCLLGPLLGGIMYEKVGFHGAFAIPIGLIAVDVALRLAMIDAKTNGDTTVKPSRVSDAHSDSYHTRTDEADIRNHDYPVVSAAIDEQSLLIERSSHYQNPQQKQRDQQATILNLLCTPRLPLALVSTMVMATILSALETTIPLFVIETFHWSSAGAGLIFIASSIPSFAGVQVGKMLHQIGVQTLSAIGFLVAAFSWFLMQLVAADTPTDISLLVCLLFLQGSAIVTLEITSMTEVSQVVGDYEDEHPGVFGEKSPVAQAYALFNMAFAGGQLLGPIVAGGVRVRAGWDTMTLVFGLLCGVTAIPTWLYSGGSQPRPVGEEEVNV